MYRCSTGKQSRPDEKLYGRDTCQRSVLLGWVLGGRDSRHGRVGWSTITADCPLFRARRLPAREEVSEALRKMEEKKAGGVDMGRRIQDCSHDAGCPPLPPWRGGL